MTPKVRSAESRWKWIGSAFCHRVETFESLRGLVEQGVSVEIKQPTSSVLYWRESGDKRWYALAPEGSPEMWADWADNVVTERDR